MGTMTESIEGQMSIPRELCKWDSGRKGSFRILAYLWSFSSAKDAVVWCFHTDQQVMAGTAIKSDRHLRMCLQDLRDAGLVERRKSPDGRPGFVLHNIEPRPIGDREEQLFRNKCSEKAEQTFRKSGTIVPAPLLKNQRQEDMNYCRLSVDEGKGFTLTPPDASSTSRRRKRRKDGVRHEDIRRVFDALCDARASIAERIGKTPRPLKLISRENAIAKALREFGVDQVVESLRNRGMIGGSKEYDILARAETPFRSPMIKRALDVDELRRLAEYADASERPVVIPLRT